MKKLLLLGALLALFAAALGLYERHEVAVFATTPHAAPREVVVTIPPRTGPKAVSDRLFAAGAVSNGRLFYWDVRYRRRVAGRLKAGQYLFKEGVEETPDEIVARLMKGEVLDVKVTIPEGLRLDEQAPIFAAHGIGDAKEFVRLARDPQFARSLGVKAKTLEGYLFPDTYSFTRSPRPRAIVAAMV